MEERGKEKNEYKKRWKSREEKVREGGSKKKRGRKGR